MAQVLPEYEKLEDFKKIAQQIISKYQDDFGHIDIDDICCYAITNKERKETNPKIIDTKAVAAPIKYDCPYAYYFVVYLTDWEEMTDKHKYLLVVKGLCSLPNNEDDFALGKIVSVDMKDHAVMLRTFGTDYLVKDDVPNILNDNINWIK